MIEYSNLMGGLISSEFPYLVMIRMGVFLTKQKIFHKEGAVSFAKLMIEIFLPIYLFINVARSTSVLLIQNNYLMIISVLLQMLMGGLISFVYIKITKMNIKYRWSWLVINCFVDHKQVHKLLINSFCYHLTTKTPNEKTYCSDVLTNNFTHVFFQDVFIWYLAFNLIRNEKRIFYNIKEFSQINKLDDAGKENSTFLKKVKEEKIDEAKKLFEEYSNNPENVNESLYDKIKDLIYEEKKKPMYYQIIYAMMRPPLIGIFVGFVVGFIPSIQAWIFTTTNAIYLFYDTFNTVGQTHIICAFLIIGANLYYEDHNSSTFSKKDFITHLIIKCLLLPFFGVIFAYVSSLYIPDHKVLIFASFIQWIMPTSIEIVAIVQSKDINAKQVCICVAIQWVWLTCLSNFIVLPAFLKAIEAI